MASQTYQDSVTLTAAAEFNKFDTAAYAALSSVAGTNTITATGPANLTLVATNPVLWFIPAATNTGATTLNITPSGGAALGAKNIFANGSACAGGELIAGVPCAIVYDGTQYNLLNSGVKLAASQASTSGTSITFTGIPAGTKKITINLVGVSTNGTSNLMVQIGDAGDIEATGYLGTCSVVVGASTGSTAFTTGFGITHSVDANLVLQGSVTLTLQNAATFTWVASGGMSSSDTARNHISGGSKSLSAELDRVRITTVGGSDTFDAGSMNITYER